MMRMVDDGSAAAPDQPIGDHGDSTVTPPSGTGEPPETGRARTGDTRVDAVLARLDQLVDTPLDEHPAVFEEIHDRLRAVLADLDGDRPPTPRPGGRAVGPGSRAPGPSR